MRPISHQLVMTMPALTALLLILLCAAPLSGGALTYTPNIAWLMALVLVPDHPSSWPRGLAFALGLVQDLVFGTPLGAQALLSLLLVHGFAAHAVGRAPQPLRIRWVEAAVILLLLHLALALMIQLIEPGGVRVVRLVTTGLINVGWYPVFYAIGTRMFATLPDTN